MTTFAARGAALVAVLLLLPGCARGGSESAPPKSQTLDRAFTLKVTGARTFTYSGRTQFAFVSRPGTGGGSAGSVAGLNTTSPVRSGGAEARLDVGIIAGYHGPDTYTIPAGLGLPAPTSGPVLPTPKGDLKWTGAVMITAGGSSARYGYVVEPCELRLDQDATVGSLSCPKLAGLDGSTVSVETTWGP